MMNELSKQYTHRVNPQTVTYKICQSFITAEQTRQGNGLCLSTIYDIVKTHDGELKVETKEGEFTSFLVLLPFQN